MKKRRRLSRKREKRLALLRSLAQSLILKEKIKTTEAKAKELSGFLEREITVAKAGNLNSWRLLRKNFPKEIVKKLINEIAPRYKERKGGYTRVIKLGKRKSDGAEMAIIELIK